MSSTLNDPAAPSGSRSPRLRVMLGQTEIPGAEVAGVTTNNWYQADTFDLSFALYAQAEGGQVQVGGQQPAFGPKWWSQQTGMILDIQIGYEAGGSVAWKSMLIGEAENIDLHLATGTVSVHGKDLSIRFIQAKTQETFANLTSSEIVRTLGLRRGLNVDMTRTTTLAGEYWAQDHTSITTNEFSRQTSEWDLMVALARYENFDLYVEGETLFFHPATKPDATPWAVRYTPPQQGDRATFGQNSNAIDLRLQRALTLANDIEVVVRSWHSGKGRGFSKTAKATGAKSAGATGKGARTQRYVYVIPNLTEDQALKRAQSLLADLSRHERVITWAEPGDLTLTPRCMARLEGTGTDFDQVYYVDSVERRIGFEEGFTMHVRAKNRDGRSQAVLS